MTKSTFRVGMGGDAGRKDVAILSLLIEDQLNIADRGSSHRAAVI
jgi:hypothetical protein